MFQVVAGNTNRVSHVLGEITAQESELVGSEDASFTRRGLYLVDVDNENPRAPSSSTCQIFI